MCDTAPTAPRFEASDDVRETRAIVAVGQMPHRIFPDRDAADAYVDQLPDDRTDGVSVWWPVDVADPDDWRDDDA